jgi:Cof subfamily protein (haloacid dehalogenase superfamily)
MDFSNYLIVTDLDGTFLAQGGRGVPQRNREAIARFCARGGRFTIATGRPHYTVGCAIPDVRELLSAPAIVCNGVYLYDYKTDKYSNEIFIPEEVARDMLAFIRETAPDVTCRVSTPTKLRTAAIKGLLLHDVALFDPENVEVQPYDAWRTDDWYKLAFREEPEVLEALRPQLEARFGEQLLILKSGTRFLELQCKGSSKAVGIERLHEYYGNEPRRTVIACGDFENDIDMLQAADVAVCPANAIDAVKALSRHVLCHCDEGLIGDIVELIEAGKL